MTIFWTFIFAAAVYFLSQNSTTVAIENTKVIVKKTSDFILPILLNTFLLAVFFSTVTIGLLTMFITHRIAGPLFRLNREVEKFKSGDLNADFHIRKDDELRVLAKNLSEMADIYKSKHGRLKEGIQKLNERLESEKSSVSVENKEFLKNYIQGIIKELNYFKN